MIGKNFGKECEGTIDDPEGQRRTGRNLCRKASRPQQAEEWAGTHESFAHMHTCIYKANIFFSENLTRQTSMKWGQDTQCSVAVKN